MPEMSCTSHRCVRVDFEQEKKHYYSGKDGLYGLKSKVSVLPTGMVIGSNVGHSGFCGWYLDTLRQ